MDRLDAIRLFVRLVESGSFSAVGREEGIGQPAVSKQIAALERYLGAQLVLRSSRRLSITDAGLSFYESARQLLDDFDAAESSVGERLLAPRGLVKVSTAPAHGRLCITPLLAEFFRRCPQVSVELSSAERSIDLVAEGFDLAIRHGKLQDSTLTARKLADTPMILAASADYLATRGEPMTLDELSGHHCIVFARGRERLPWEFLLGRETLRYPPQGSLLTGDAEQIRAAVLLGLGISQAPLWLFQQEINQGKVRALLQHMQPPPLPIHLVYPSGRRMPMRVRVFVDYLLSAYGGMNQ